MEWDDKTVEELIRESYTSFISTWKSYDTPE